MNRKTMLLMLGLILASLSWTVAPGFAEPQDVTPSTPKTGNFRDPANVPKFRSTTNAQREEAAKRMAERRAAAGMDTVKGGVPATTTPTPQNTEGGTK